MRWFRKVYPRVCGGTTLSRKAFTTTRGLSPRVRGNPEGILVAGNALRSIPACAGEPAPAGLCRCGCAVYPRVCGGTGATEDEVLTALGLSPRVRGNQRQDDIILKRSRSIPACAGEPSPTRYQVARPPVYPRVCGGTAAVAKITSASCGLSPRVRGNHHDCRPVWFVTGSIPACAGEPPHALGQALAAGVYPRVCGGTLASG